jgi:ribosomal protection tetracycline resistance protein
MRGYVRDTLRSGLYGWRVTDCVVTLAQCAYSVADGPPSRRGPTSTAADFRKLTPLVLRQALESAGTVVCEPVHRFRLDAPAATLGQVLPALVRHQAVPDPPAVDGSAAVVEGDVPAAAVQRLRLELPHVTGGEGSLETVFDRYEPVTGRPPVRE